MYDQENVTYSQLFVAAWKAEMEGSEKKTNDGTGVKVKAATADHNDISQEMKELKKHV